MGAAALRRRPHVEGAGVAADARNAVARAVTPVSEVQESAHRNNHHRKDNEACASDYTMTATVAEDQVTVFAVVDRCATKCVVSHACSLHRRSYASRNAMGAPKGLFAS